MAKFNQGETLYDLYNSPISILEILPLNKNPHTYQIYKVKNHRNNKIYTLNENEITLNCQRQLGKCRFRLNDLVKYTPLRYKKTVDKPFIVVDIKPQEDGNYFDKNGFENYWIKDSQKGEKFLAQPSELDFY